MIKKSILILLFLTISLNANIVRMRAVEQAPTKQEAIENAHWVIFEQALDKIIGASSYVGNIKTSFKTDMQKDFIEFQKTYFRSPKTKCNNLGENGYECLVLANLNLEQIKAIVADKSTNTTTMGKNSVQNLEIVLIDEVNNELSKDFISNLQGAVNDNGNSLRIEKKGTQLGVKGNKCNNIQRQYEQYKKKGASYKKALIKIEEKLNECKNNKDVKYLFKLTKIKFNTLGKDSYNNITGNLIYRINMIDVQTGKIDNAIRSANIEDFAPNKESLKFRLYQKAANVATREITNNLLKSIRLNSKTKKIAKIKKYDYFYTIILSGITYDSTNIDKIRFIKRIIKTYHAKAKRNTNESKDYEQVYNFGTNEEIDTEDLIFDIYEKAKQASYAVQIEDKDNNVIVVKFQ